MVRAFFGQALWAMVPTSALVERASKSWPDEPTQNCFSSTNSRSNAAACDASSARAFAASRFSV